jgi:hypothetical protein
MKHFIDPTSVPWSSTVSRGGSHKENLDENLRLVTNVEFFSDIAFPSTVGTHKTSGFKTSGFKTSGFKTSGFKTSGLLNVMFTKRQVSKGLVSKRPVFKIDIFIIQKIQELPS